MNAAEALEEMRRGNRVTFAGGTLSASWSEPNRTVYCQCGDEGCCDTEQSEGEWLRQEEDDFVVVAEAGQS